MAVLWTLGIVILNDIANGVDVGSGRSDFWILLRGAISRSYLRLVVLAFSFRHQRHWRLALAHQHQPEDEKQNRRQAVKHVAKHAGTPQHHYHDGEHRAGDSNDVEAAYSKKSSIKSFPFLYLSFKTEKIILTFN